MKHLCIPRSFLNLCPRVDFVGPEMTECRFDCRRNNLQGHAGQLQVPAGNLRVQDGFPPTLSAPEFKLAVKNDNPLAKNQTLGEVALPLLKVCVRPVPGGGGGLVFESDPPPPRVSSNGTVVTLDLSQFIHKGLAGSAWQTQEFKFKISLLLFPRLSYDDGGALFGSFKNTLLFLFLTVYYFCFFKIVGIHVAKRNLHKRHDFPPNFSFFKGAMGFWLLPSIP